jgi:hypothetical protein
LLLHLRLKLQQLHLLQRIPLLLRMLLLLQKLLLLQLLLLKGRRLELLLAAVLLLPPRLVLVAPVAEKYRQADEKGCDAACRCSGAISCGLAVGGHGAASNADG